MPLSDFIDGDARTAIYLVARREFLTRVRSRIFRFGTLALVILVPGYMLLQAYVINKSAGKVKVGFNGATVALEAPMKASASALGLNLEARTVDDLGSARAKVKNGDLDAVVTGQPAAPTAIVKDKLDPTLEAALTSLAKQAALNQALANARVDPRTIAAPVAAARVQVQTIDPNASQRAGRDVVGVITAVVLYVSLLLYGNLVAQGVVEEKSSRVVEILLSTIRARNLLLGKVLGIGLVGVVQIVIVGVAALVTAQRTQKFGLPNISPDIVLGGIVWFVLGFVFYALAYAAMASLASRQEDVSAVTMPLTFVVLGAYLAFFWVLANPTNAWAVALSVTPALSPVIMPARVASGDAQLWQVGLALVLQLLAIVAMNWVAARIYANSILRMGARVSLRDAWGAGKVA